MQTKKAQIEPIALREKQAAQFLQMPVLDLVKLRKAGKIPHNQVTRNTVFYSRRGLIEWRDGDRENPYPDMPRPCRQTGWIYFIQCGEDGPVKIGFTAHAPSKRLRTIKCDCPYPLHLRGVRRGNRRLEKRLHIHFAIHHERGEWFRPAAEIFDYMNAKGDSVEFKINVDAIKANWKNFDPEMQWMMLCTATQAGAIERGLTGIQE